MAILERCVRSNVTVLPVTLVYRQTDCAILGYVLLVGMDLGVKQVSLHL
jgi:hypothetical protein